MADTETNKENMGGAADDGAREKTQYELALLLKSEDDMPTVATVIRQHNGEMTSEPRARKLALAYKIKGNTEAAFVTCFFRAAGEDAKQLEQDLRMRSDVIRSMIVRAATQGGIPVAAATSAFPDRPGGRGAAFHGTGAGSREPKKQPAREPISNEALENLLKEI